MAKKTNNTAKTRAWNRFSQWVKVSGCLKTTGYPFAGVCITCGKKFHIRALQAGHMKGGRHNGILFHEKLTNLQCVICNERYHGKPKKYRKKMVEIYSEEKVAQWEQEASQIIHEWDMDYKAIEEKYREATNKLLIPFGYSTYEALLEGNQN